MNPHRNPLATIALCATLLACADVRATAPASAAPTDSRIAWANLDHLIAQSGDEPEVVDLLLQRSRYLADVHALDRIVVLTESHAGSAGELIRRARARAAVHRFDDALADLDAAQRAGASPAAIQAQRSSIRVATGRAGDELAGLQAAAARRPGFASHCALALAEAAAGRLEDADAHYGQALGELDTTSPFPAAAIWFARGLMWSEQGGDPRRGEAMYAQALRGLPEYVAANVHLAELEAARGDLRTAIVHAQQAVAAGDDPEALALLGTLHIRDGRETLGRDEIERARRAFEALLARHPQAFADHAAEFYLGAGADPERGLHWAQVNLLVRETRRALQLGIRAARETGHVEEARFLEQRLRERFDPRAG
jgi:tetratricopeptide (TPR) repeat protein